MHMSSSQICFVLHKQGMSLLVNDPVSASSSHASEISLPLLMDLPKCIFFNVEITIVYYLRDVSGLMTAKWKVYRLLVFCPHRN